MRLIGLRTVAVVTLLGLSSLWCAPVSAQGKTTKADPVNLTKFIGPDFCVAVVVHPSRILKSPVAEVFPPQQAAGAAAVTADGPMAAKLQKVLDPKMLRRVVVLLDPTPEGGMPVSPAVIAQFDQDFDASILEDPEIVTKEHEGFTYHASKTPGKNGVTMAAYVAGPRTVLAASETILKKMLTPSEGPRPLLDQLRRASLKNDIGVEILVEPLAKAFPMKAAGPPGGPADMQTAALKEMKSASMAINFSGETLATLTIVMSKEEAADQLNGMLALFKMMADGKLQELKGQPAGPGAVPGPIFDLGEQLLKGLKVRKDGDSVVASVAMPENFPELLKEVAEAAKQMVPPGLPGAMPGAVPAKEAAEK